MDKVDWKLILSNYDTVKYFPKSDLVELSKICKFMRNKLFRYIFKDIVLYNFLGGLDKSPYNDICSDERKREILARCDERLKDIIPHVRSLVIEYEYNEILLLCIPRVFDNISKLQLYETTLTPITFDKLMNGLNQLEFLSLKEFRFIIFDANNIPLSLQFPSSLVSFKILNGELMHAEFNPSFSLSDYLNFSDGSFTTILKFNIQRDSFPNLKILEIDQDSQDFMETQNSLLSTSNQLTHFTTRLSLIDEFSSINLQSLTSLTLTNIHQSHQIPINFTFPILQNLKELRILADFTLNEFEENLIISRFQNFINIGKNIEKLALPYIKSDSFSIEDILQTFWNLKELSLVSSNKLIALNSEKFPKIVKILNLYNINPKFIDMKNIIHCSELNFINIYYESKNISYLKIEDTEFFNEINGWRIIRFPGVGIKCYSE